MDETVYKTFIALKEEYLESVDKRLQEIEKKMDTLSSLFLWGPIGGDEERDPGM